MKRSNLINAISTTGLMGVLAAITPAGWDTDPRVRLLTIILFVPALILCVALFVLARLDHSAWSIISFLTNLMLGVIVLAMFAGAYL